MKVTYRNKNIIKIEEFSKHIGKVVKSKYGEHYIISWCAGKLYMIDINDFKGSFIGDSPVDDEFELVDSELIING